MSAADWNDLALVCVAGVLALLAVVGISAAVGDIPPYRDHDGGGL